MIGADSSPRKNQSPTKLSAETKLPPIPVPTHASSGSLDSIKKIREDMQSNLNPQPESIFNFPDQPHHHHHTNEHVVFSDSSVQNHEGFTVHKYDVAKAHAVIDHHHEHEHIHSNCGGNCEPLPNIEDHSHNHNHGSNPDLSRILGASKLQPLPESILVSDHHHHHIHDPNSHVSFSADSFDNHEGFTVHKFDEVKTHATPHPSHRKEGILPDIDAENESLPVHPPESIEIPPETHVHGILNSDTHGHHHSGHISFSGDPFKEHEGFTVHQFDDAKAHIAHLTPEKSPKKNRIEIEPIPSNDKGSDSPGTSSPGKQFSPTPPAEKRGSFSRTSPHVNLHEEGGSSRCEQHILPPHTLPPILHSPGSNSDPKYFDKSPKPAVGVGSASPLRDSVDLSKLSAEVSQLKIFIV